MFKYFKFNEVFRNCSDSEVIECVRNNYISNLIQLLMFLDAFREYIESPIIINSSFRDSCHNALVGGSPTSQHLLGAAIDFTTSKRPISEVHFLFKTFARVSPLSKYLGQCILYPTFIHIGLRTASHNKLVIYDKRDSKNNHQSNLHNS